MIDFYLIFRLIKENLATLLFIGVLFLALLIFWDKIEYLWESQQGEIEFFNDYHHNRQNK
jgi:hypothetical protein